MKTVSPPFVFLQDTIRNQLMKVMIVLALGMTAVMNIIGSPLTTEVASAGILSYEFAWNIETAQAILASWDAHDRLVAAFSLGLDFLYPVLYAAAISLACVWATRCSPRRLTSKPDQWSGYRSRCSALAFICAMVKFLLVIVGILYVLVAWLAFKAKPA